MRGSMCVIVALCLVFPGVAGSEAQTPQQQKPAPPPDASTPELQQLEKVPEPVAGDALKTKLDSYLVVTFGPRAVVSPMISAGIRMAHPNENYPGDWRQGMQGFARQYGSSMGTKAAFETARFGVGALLHEDFRYRPSNATGFFPRASHALGFAFVDRSDSGHRRLAFANLAGAAAGGFTPTLWLPDGFNSRQDGAKRMGTKFGGFVIQNELREFSPEIGKLFRSAHLPFPRLPLPEWWTKDISVARRP
jgi:hypothetical protein